MVNSLQRFSIPDTLNGGAALIYKALPAFSVFEQTDGLGPIEGPYPQWNLPHIRWGIGAQSSLIAQGPPNSRAKLFILASGHANEGQNLSVLIDGELKLNAGVPTEFTNYEIPIEFGATGTAKIVLRYGVPATNAVLYKALVIRPLY